MNGSGYDARVFSVIVWSSNRTRRCSSRTTFSSTVPNMRVVAKISGSASAERLMTFA